MRNRSRGQMAACSGRPRQPNGYGADNGEHSIGSARVRELTVGAGGSARAPPIESIELSWIESMGFESVFCAEYVGSKRWAAAEAQVRCARGECAGAANRTKKERSGRAQTHWQPDPYRERCVRRETDPVCTS